MITLESRIKELEVENKFLKELLSNVFSEIKKYLEKEEIP